MAGEQAFRPEEMPVRGRLGKTDSLDLAEGARDPWAISLRCSQSPRRRGHGWRGREGTRRIQGWPEESREAVQLVIDQCGEPDETCETQLTWHKPGPWKRIVASKAFHRHDFPAPHTDSVESVIDCRVPVDKVTALAEFDGSVVVKCSKGCGLSVPWSLAAVQRRAQTAKHHRVIVLRIPCSEQQHRAPVAAYGGAQLLKR